MVTRFVRHERYMHVNIDYPLDLDAIKTLSLEFMGHPQFETGMNVLWDARAVPQANLSFDDMRAFGEFLAPLRPQRGGGRSAFLAPQDLLFGLFRIHALLNQQQVSYDFHVFRDFDAAHQWLSED